MSPPATHVRSDPFALGDRIETVIGVHAAQTPDAVAVRQGSEDLGYAELWRRSGELAGRIREQGAGVGHVVAVTVNRSPERIIALLAALRAGAAYVAVDTAWPEERIDDLLDRARPTCLVTGEALEVSSHPSGRTWWDPVDPTGHDPASVFFTSGSTGSPKGVVVTHRGTMRVLRGEPLIPLGPESVLLQAAAVAWDMHSFEVWGALLNGGTIVLPEGNGPIDLPEMRRALHAGVNAMFLTTTLFNVVAEDGPDILAGLDWVLFGGEKASVRHARAALEATDGLVLHGYGPAECTMIATAHRVIPDDVAPGLTSLPMGHPLAHTGHLLLDDHGRPIETPEPGRVGELALTGEGLAWGYLGDPTQTDEHFVHIGGVRAYRTGDLVRTDETGALHFVGRSDRQLKIHGIRIEPGEVEAAIESHPRVHTAVVTPIEGPHGRLEIGAVVRTVDGEDVSPDELGHHVARTLLPVMVPSVWRSEATLPIGPTGKTDLRAVAAMLTKDLHSRHSVESGPSGDRVLAGVPELIGRPFLRADDDLVAGGISSLDAVRVAARLGGPAGVLGAGDVYRLRTVAALRAYAASLAPAATATEAESFHVDVDVAPLSRAQRRFWLAEQMSPGACDNIVVLGYTWPGALDVPRLQRALDVVCARHPVLSTIYEWNDVEPSARLVPGLVPRVSEVVTPSGVTDERAVAEAIAEDWWSTPFDLETDSPMRVRCCRTGADTSVLCVAVHHVAFDGWSERLFLDDLVAAYAGLELEAQPVRYAEHAAWEDAQVERWIEADLPFWRDVLADLPAPVLPAPTGGGEAGRCERVMRIDPDVARALTAASGLSVAGLLTATGRALGKTLGTERVTVGVPTRGRPTEASDEVVGYFVNPVPVVIASTDEASDEIADRVLAALDHARIPFDDLVARLPPSDRSRHPIFQAWCVMQAERPHPTLPEGPVVPLRIRPPRTAIELVVEATPDPDGAWEVVVAWRDDGLDEETGEALVAGLRAAIIEAGSR